MESIHGVDVSWLHHSQKDPRSQNVGLDRAIEATKDGGAMQSQKLDSERTTWSSETTGDSESQTHHYLYKPHLKTRRSLERAGQAQHSPKSPRDPKPLPPSSPGRRNSWISSISSKFSSSGITSTVAANPGSPSVINPSSNSQAEELKPIHSTHSLDVREIKRPDASGSQSPQSTKSGSGSFIHNALRRLSSASSVAGLGKMTSTAGACQRRVMNVDPYRERCHIEDLQPAKLRRVAFCVDVEIAGASKYTDEQAAESSPPPPARRSSLTQLEHQVDVKKKKDQKLKEQSEGEALKNPQALTGETGTEESVKSIEQSTDPSNSTEDNLTEVPTNGEVQDPSRKKEKKKRSEEERKERKERRKQEAVENGSVPVELSLDDSSAGDSSPGSSTPLKVQDRPTTDPLRIYRRCCQLRESPVLKRITEQLASPCACDPSSPNTIICLDISGYWMQPSDVTTLGDYLAVVPVKKLVLENCGLNDEAVRVILAGLLAAKTPSQAKHNKSIAKKKDGHSKSEAEQLGVVEKLSLKNNPKIGKNGWRYIGLFIYMSRSLKAIDLSMIPFPQSTSTTANIGSLIRPHNAAKSPTDVPTIFQKALATRLAGPQLEELVMAECGLDTGNIQRIVDGVIQCGSTRLGLASNEITLDGLESVARFVRKGKCEGLDLGGNDLSKGLHILTEALDEENMLYALSLADCNLSPPSLMTLFPALVRLPNFRFIDLSHNRNLFLTQPNALGLLRKYLPLLPMLKRVHLADVALSPDHAIALAEVLPESSGLAHLNILENPLISALAEAKDEASQEEACALYASLMAAVRVSDSIICIDVDVPSQDSSEVVKALAKQVAAYSLRNMEHNAVAETYSSAAASVADHNGGEKLFDVPEILLHLVGHVDGFPEDHDDDEPAPDDDYIVGGTGVVKALGVCLGNRAVDYRRPSRDGTTGESGTATPKQVLHKADVTNGKAKDMSKNLLGSARKIRARLQPALAREAQNGDAVGCRRLQFLDSTLGRMIQRFEDEYPECRVELPVPSPSSNDAHSDFGSSPSSFTNPFDPDHKKLANEPSTEDKHSAVRVPVSRHNSDVSIASRYLGQEEGRMHRIGQHIRREILRPQTLDYAHGTTGQEVEAPHLQELRQKLEALGGDEIKEMVERQGLETVFKQIGTNTEELLLLEKQDPEGFEKFKESQLTAQRNIGRAATEEVQGHETNA